jgi:putative ABC transport system permease protein
MYAWRTLTKHPARTFLTIGGIALCVMLMMFLLGVYRGVAEGSIAYVRDTPADLWVLQGHATNILRGSSILTNAHGSVLSEIPGVASASPVLLILVGAKTGDGTSTIYLVGFDPATGVGGPPHIAEGRNVQNDDELVIDQAFAALHHVGIGSRVSIMADTLTVVGKSAGTNAFVVQYAFASFRQTQAIIGLPSLVSCYIVRVAPGWDRLRVLTAITEELPSVNVFEKDVFLSNNRKEMESGFLPLLFAVAAIGSIVLSAILTLLLMVLILECRGDIAVMRAIGASSGMVSSLLFGQAGLLAAGSLVAGLCSYPVLVAVVGALSPEIEARFAPEHVLIVIGIVLGAVGASYLVSAGQLRRIYPLEALQ